MDDPAAVSLRDERKKQVPQVAQVLEMDDAV
jgi:hypothetical protein